MDESTAHNHDHWEQLATFHGNGDDDYYDFDAIIAGGSRMGAPERAALERAVGPRGLEGKRVAHVQSHLGLDSITMARSGAEVTAIDFSKTALTRLDELATKCGVNVATVEADSRRLPLELNECFDLAYATIGVLCWIDDLDAWMTSVQRILKPGGQLVLVECHPLLSMIDTVEPLIIDFPYGGGAEFTFSGTGTYANRDAAVTWTTKQYPHSLGEIITACITAGLRVTYVEEHTECDYSMGKIPGPEADGYCRIRLGSGSSMGDPTVPGEPLPVLFTLLATNDGVASLPVGAP
jgi:ubiquinone/menaquinone biosynthesis C-methylase UbiE